VTAFFARRCRDPQQVADLTSQTFVEAIRSVATYQGRGTPRAWLIAIARRVYANHVDDQASGADLIDRLGGRLELADDELERIWRSGSTHSATDEDCSSAPPACPPSNARRSSSSTCSG
jgi:DNA-directed RNA polymerase specialized sigma24 family protein